MTPDPGCFGGVSCRAGVRADHCSQTLRVSNILKFARRHGKRLKLVFCHDWDGGEAEIILRIFFFVVGEKGREGIYWCSSAHPSPEPVLF